MSKMFKVKLTVEPDTRAGEYVVVTCPKCGKRTYGVTGQKGKKCPVCRHQYPMPEGANAPHFKTPEEAIQIPRNQADRILANQSTRIAHIQVLPPPTSGQRAVASILLKGPEDVIHPPSAMMKEFPGIITPQGQPDLRWGQDTNRPYCPWMIAFNRVDKDDKEINFTNDKVPLYHLAWLAGLGRPGVRISVPTNAYRYFDKTQKVLTQFLHRPTPEKPCHLRADPKVALTFHENIGMLPFMREARRVRILEEMRCTQRHRSILNKSRGTESPGGKKTRDAQRGRVRAKLRNMNDRFDNLREEMLADGERIMAYMIYRFNITHFAYEKVKFSPWGKLGSLSKIQRAMVKNPGDLVSGAKILFDRAGVKWPVESIEPVGAAGTSQTVTDSSGRKARPDRRISADWPVALFWDEKGIPSPVIVRSHVQSAAEIARRAERPKSISPPRPSAAGVRFVMALSWPEEEKRKYLHSVGIDDPLSFGDGPPPQSPSKD